MTPVHRSTPVQKPYLCWSAAQSDEVDRENPVHPDKTAGQKGWSTGPPLKGIKTPSSGDRLSPLGHADQDPADDLPDHEPTDEELWLVEVARHVEADARPLFAHTWIWLLHRALAQDEAEPA